MRKVIILLVAVMVVSLVASWEKVHGQTPTVTVIQGTSHTYSVTPVPNGANYEYHWSVNGGTSSALGTNRTTNSILWDGAPGQYTLTVYAVNPTTGCAGNNQNIIINVIAMGGFTLTGPSEVCPHTDNQTGDFEITVAYTGSGAWSYVLTDGVTNRTINVNAGTTTSTVTIPGYANASSSNVATHVLRITSVTTSDGTVTYDGNETNASNHRISVNVQPTPATSGIIQN